MKAPRPARLAPRSLASAAVLAFAILASVPVASAQATTVTLQCHTLASSGNYLASDETIVNGLACKTVAAPAPKPEAVAMPVADPKPAAPEVLAPVKVEDATIYFYRPRRIVGFGLKPTVFVDDARAGRLKNGDSIKLSIAPGDHRIYSTDKSTGMELDAKPGETYYVRVDIQTGAFKGHGGVTLVDPQEGKYEAGQAARSGGADDDQ